MGSQRRRRLTPPLFEHRIEARDRKAPSGRLRLARSLAPATIGRQGMRREEDASVASEEEARIAADLVRRIADGDRSAESEMVERYSRGLRFLLRRMTGAGDLAEDLHQDTFRIVLERLRGKGLEEPERLAGFLNRTARNLFLADHRKRARRRTDGLGDFEPPVAVPPDQLRQTLLDEEADLVRKLLDEVEPDRARQILFRFYIAEEPKERICADLELSGLHFNRVLFRARQRFKQLLERSEKARWLEEGTS